MSTGLWWCSCGYRNVNRAKCLMCELPASDGAPYGPQGAWEGEHELEDEQVLSRPIAMATKKAGRTVAAIIILNLVIQVVEYAIFTANDVEPATAIGISLVTALAYYGVAAVWVMARSADLHLRPRSGIPTALVGAAEGFVVGGVAAILLSSIFRLVSGRPVLDPTASLLVSQGSVVALLLGVVMIVLAAPVAEELVFRGFLAESFRSRGRRAAVLASAVAFAVAHLRLSQFRYYLIMGALLALVYWRRGLVGSIAAHATFNGMLVLTAAAAAHGPGQVVQLAGSELKVPNTYEVAEHANGVEIAAVGPVGSRAEFASLSGGGGLPSAEELLREVSRGQFRVPAAVSIDPGSASIIRLPAGQAVSMDADIDGRDGRVVLLPEGRRLWVAVHRTDGTSGSADDFDDMLESWKLP